ncbi:hypothetical protein DFH09DRAFT_127441 [Mycena vulgaris]|nr:hypothetical protein DFH09DRAFT_127441 [Mycena vulgaris]
MIKDSRRVPNGRGMGALVRLPRRRRTRGGVPKDRRQGDGPRAGQMAHSRPYHKSRRKLPLFLRSRGSADPRRATDVTKCSPAQCVYAESRSDPSSNTTHPAPHSPTTSLPPSIRPPGDRGIRPSLALPRPAPTNRTMFHRVVPMVVPRTQDLPRCHFSRSTNHMHRNIRLVLPFPCRKKPILLHIGIRSVPARPPALHLKGLPPLLLPLAPEAYPGACAVAAVMGHGGRLAHGVQGPRRAVDARRECRHEKAEEQREGEGDGAPGHAPALIVRFPTRFAVDD